MSAGSGRISPQPFAFFDRDGLCWKTSVLSLYEDLLPSKLTWPRSGICVRGYAYARPMWALRTGASGSSWSPFSLLRTPTAQLAVNGGSQPPAKRLAGGHQPTLADQVEHDLPVLPTPRCADGLNETGETTRARLDRGTRPRGTIEEAVACLGADLPVLPTPRTTDRGGMHWSPATLRGTHGRDLAPTVGSLGPVPLLPTPAAGNFNDGETPAAAAARRARELAKRYNGNGGGEQLAPVVAALELLPTPTAADGERTSLTYPRGNETLAGALLPTPSARDQKGPGTGYAGRVRADGRVRGEGDATLPMAVGALLPTPGATDGKGSAGTGWRPRDGRPRPASDADLPEAVSLLPTPRVADGISGTPGQRGSSGDLMLAPAVLGLPPSMLLPTPQAALGLGGHLTRGQDRSDEYMLPGLARAATEGRALRRPPSTGSSTARRSSGGRRSPDSGHPTLFDPPG
jgi:hypothetical protein